MHVRSITIGIEATWPLGAAPLATAGRFLTAARRRFADEGLSVQTVRCATQPFPEVLGWRDAGSSPALARTMQDAARAEGIEYCSLGPVPAGRRDGAAEGFLAALPEMLCATETVFATAEIANRKVGFDFAAIAAAASTIRAVADGSEAGFGNLRFAAIANCPPNTPFFPASYHGGGPARFSIALEMADVAVAALTAADPAQADEALAAAVQQAVDVVEAVALDLERECGVAYEGVDLSPAPFPTRERSIGEAAERLGVAGFGSPGTLYAAALITRALRRVQARRCGFSGLMMPVLEDAVLAQRAAEGLFSVSEALLYSAVCGTGLDTVPLAGDVTAGQLQGILLDVAALSLALDKPLTARLMPVPGKKAGEPTEFDFPYFANSVAMPVHGQGAAALVRRALQGA